jgi:hypothetical protein
MFWIVCWWAGVLVQKGDVDVCVDRLSKLFLILQLTPLPGARDCPFCPSPFVNSIESTTKTVTIRVRKKA